MLRRDYLATAVTISGSVAVTGCSSMFSTTDDSDRGTDNGEEKTTAQSTRTSEPSPTETDAQPTETDTPTTPEPPALPTGLRVHYPLQDENLTESWTEHPHNPVLEDQGDPDVLIHDGTYYLYTVDRSEATKRQFIRLFVSADGIEFREHANSPVVSRSASSWDSGDVSDPSIVTDGETYYLYYSGASTPGQSGSHIGVATASSPLGPFSKHSVNPILYAEADWERKFLTEPHVRIHDGTFYLTYTGRNSNNEESIGLATSSDGVHFTKEPANPILVLDDINDQCHLYANGAWHLYYTNKADDRSIHKSVSSDLSSFTGTSQVLQSSLADYAPTVRYDPDASEYKMYWHKLDNHTESSFIYLATVDDLADTRIVDQSGTENAGIRGGETLPTPTASSGLWGGPSITFSDGYVRSSAPLSPAETGNWAASVWLYPAEDGTDQFIMGDPSQDWWIVSYDSSDEFRWRLSNGSGDETANIGTSPQRYNQWYFLALSYDHSDSSAVAYLGDRTEDGVQTVGTATEFEQDPWSADLIVGALPESSRPFNGRIANVRFYADSLTKTDVETLYATALSRDQAQ